MPPYRNTRSKSRSPSDAHSHSHYHSNSHSLSHPSLRSSTGKERNQSHPLFASRQPSTQSHSLKIDDIPLISHRLNIPITSNTALRPSSSLVPLDYSDSTPTTSSSPASSYTNEQITLVRSEKPISDEKEIRFSSSLSYGTTYSWTQQPLTVPRLTIGQHIRDTSYILSEPKRNLSLPLDPPSNSFRISAPKMVFQSHVNYLSSKVQVHFENEGIMDMLGGPNTETSYSLPGHIIISVPALPASLEGRLREVKDLKLVMEGKSEFWDDHGRYSPMRLYTTTLILATPSSPLLLPSHDPSRPHAQNIQLAVVFDMRLPGWLPPSHDTDLTTISYGLIAQSTVGWTDSATTIYAAPSIACSSSSILLNGTDISTKYIQPMRPIVVKPRASKSFDSIFGNHSLLAKSTEKSQSTWSPFIVQRHRLPCAIGTSIQDPTDRVFILTPGIDSMSPIECVTTTADWVDINGDEKSLKINLKVRARRRPVDLQPMDVDSSSENATDSTSPLSQPASTSATEPDMSFYEVGTGNLDSVPMMRHGARSPKNEIPTHILELGMEVEETERYSSTPSQSFITSFPLPEEQPSRNSSQHQLISPRSNYADGGFLGYDDRPFKGIKTTKCLLTDDGSQRNFLFDDEGLLLGYSRWRIIKIVLPMPRLGAKESLSMRPQSDLDGPFLRVRHDLKIRVLCKTADSEHPQNILLSTPIRFGSCPSTMPSAQRKTPPLPTYLQLFHGNGDQRCDPLPIYDRFDEPLTCIRPVPTSPAPSYASLYPSNATHSLRSSSPSSYSESSSSSSLGRGERSISPSPSSIDTPMDIDNHNIDSDDGSTRDNQLTPMTATKVAETIPTTITTIA
ncbi:uncharacterized protein I206_102492 [Kwoniella pini CBS 10737]|uniref:Uncharacterized protein n=1 Tax=Kwoniella pini CBS 10737 TaxID=1296096 RepID=A0A1B9I5K2_9TREE|nr:uncharacterized protein I206_02843 [Kwoniella pini CBS 10737]OCF50787.1 hypothetical protein I206_02843 [Kwoniella pini CBS 10737]